MKTFLHQEQGGEITEMGKTPKNNFDLSKCYNTHCFLLKVLFPSEATYTHRYRVLVARREIHQGDVGRRSHRADKSPVVVHQL